MATPPSASPRVRDLLDLPDQVRKGDFVLKLTEGVVDPEKTAGDFGATPPLVDAFDRALGLVGSALRDGKSQAAYLHGSFGSGKSHFMEEYAGDESARLHESLEHWEGRFDSIKLEDRNLPAVVEKRVVRPKDAAARAQLDAAFEMLRRGAGDSWDTMLGALDGAAFRQLYPFSPALVDALVTLKEEAGKSAAAVRALLGRWRSEGRPTLEDARKHAEGAVRGRVSKFQVCLPEALLQDLLVTAAVDVDGARRVVEAGAPAVFT